MSGDRPAPGTAVPTPDPARSGATPTGSEPEKPETPQTPDELAADVARQREQLAETVEQLQERLDVRSRMSDAMTTADGSLRPELIAALAAGVAAVVGLAVLRWRRSR
ncbi:DUF3618 domain-containing protein [Nocardioides ochotonae]|uniref:DUF3618 domain-containing protein n=1 Tax=Nocardioides ochotonae TaxID=2685869 RepID=UPI001409AB77|nr:DUF3618 domain-containing protein [Nocardioides ochotonae]